MGNCQAVDAAALVIQHPCGKMERLYSSVTASEVMRMNPGHYVSLIIPLQLQQQQQNQDQNTVRITQVKLLRPNETLTLGHAYRLITTQEVVNVLRAKKHAKTRKPPPQASESSEQEGENSHTGKPYQAMTGERQRVRTNSGRASLSVRYNKSWRPSLQSISESGSSTTVKSCAIIQSACSQNNNNKNAS